MKYRVTHTTTYHYSAPVALSHNQVHLVPRGSERQTCLISRQQFSPAPSAVRSWSDYFGNTAGFFVIEQPHQELIVLSESMVEVHPPEWPAPASTAPWETARDQLDRYADDPAIDALPYLYGSPMVQLGRPFAEYAAPSFSPGRPILEAALELTERLHREFRYDSTATAVSTPTADVLRLRRGVCQDFAHLEIACLRSLGLAARYVSGYLLTDPPPGQAKLIGADASHAWLAVWCPGHGWVELDPTNACLPAERHVTIAWGRDYGDVSPVKGVVLGGGNHTMTIAVDVSRAV